MHRQTHEKETQNRYKIISKTTDESEEAQAI